MTTKRRSRPGAAATVLGADRLTGKQIGERLLTRLEELGWSRRRLAMEASRYAGCDVVGESQVSRILAGERYVPLTVKTLADTMGLSFVWLTTGIGPRLIPRSADEQFRQAEENDPRLLEIRRLCVGLDDEKRNTVLGLARMLAGVRKEGKA